MFRAEQCVFVCCACCRAEARLCVLFALRVHRRVVVVVGLHKGTTLNWFCHFFVLKNTCLNSVKEKNIYIFIIHITSQGTSLFFFFFHSQSAGLEVKYDRDWTCG